jgi:Lipocalin-like domain
MSEKPMGIIMYTPDGYMSAQLMHPNRKPFASGDWFKGTDEEYRQEASTYIAYSGEFHVDEEKGTLTHSMFVSLRTIPPLEPSHPVHRFNGAKSDA